MSYLGLIAGELVGTVGTKIAKEFIQAVTPDKGENFFDIFQKNVNEKKLHLDDLQLNPSEQSSVMDLRDLAMKKGLQSFEVEIEGSKYQLNTKDLSLTPVLA